MGNSLAKERMLEKAEQVRGGGFFLTYNLTIIGLKGPVREDEHKATARHPFGKVSGIEKVLNFYSQRDPGLQHKVLYWIIDIMGEGPRGKTDFDHWIQEPTVLARVIRASLFSDQKKIENEEPQFENIKNEFMKMVDPNNEN